MGSADGSAAGYPVVVFGGKHVDVPIAAEMGGALGRMIARQALVCVVDPSELCGLLPGTRPDSQCVDGFDHALDALL